MSAKKQASEKARQHASAIASSSVAAIRRRIAKF